MDEPPNVHFLLTLPMSHVFICYARKDTTRVDELVDQIAAAGFKIWIDRDGIPPGRRWTRVIGEAIMSAGVFVVMLSEPSVISDNVFREVSLAIEKKIPIVPARLDDVDIPIDLNYFLSPLQKHDVFAEGIEPLIAALNNYAEPTKSEHEPDAPNLPKATLPGEEPEAEDLSRLDQLSAEDFERIPIWLLPHLEMTPNERVLFLADDHIAALHHRCWQRGFTVFSPVEKSRMEAMRRQAYIALDIASLTPELCTTIEQEYLSRTLT